LGVAGDDKLNNSVKHAPALTIRSRTTIMLTERATAPPVPAPIVSDADRQ
jgi:hypothetical protein